MKMKKIILNVALVFAAAVMGSCDSFFEVDTDDTLDGSEYISEESEMYSGYTMPFSSLCDCVFNHPFLNSPSVYTIFPLPGSAT